MQTNAMDLELVKAATPLVLTAGAPWSSSARIDGSAPEWRFVFRVVTGTCPSDASGPWLLRITGVEPTRLAWLGVEVGSRLTHEIDSIGQGGRALASAGEIVESMARMSGLRGLALEIPRSAGGIESMWVWLRVRARGDEVPDAPRVTLEAR